MNIGIIGAGNVSRTLSVKLVKLGHKVYAANSRGPESLKEFAQETGAIPVTVQEAANSGDVVIITIPEKNVADLPKDLFKDVPESVVVIDTGNYYPTIRDGVVPGIDTADITESEWVQNQIGRPVIKAFNSIAATSLKDFSKPKGETDRIAIPVSGDDSHARHIVMQMVDDLGFDPVDSGKISESWKQQGGTSVYCTDLRAEEMISCFKEMPAVRTAELRKSLEDNRDALIAAYFRSLQANTQE